MKYLCSVFGKNSSQKSIQETNKKINLRCGMVFSMEEVATPAVAAAMAAETRVAGAAEGAIVHG